MIKVSLAQWREDLQALLPIYWAKWDAELEQRFQDHEVEQLSMGYLEGLRDYVDRGPTRRPDGLSLETLLALHTTEAQVRHELDTAYSRMPERVGLVETVAMHSFHFLVRDHQNEMFLAYFHNWSARKLPAIATRSSGPTAAAIFGRAASSARSSARRCRIGSSCCHPSCTSSQRGMAKAPATHTSAGCRGNPA